MIGDPVVINPSGASHGAEMVGLRQQFPKEFDVQFRFVNDDGIPYVGFSYTAINTRTGEQVFGTTNEDGWTQELFSDNQDNFKVYLDLPWQQNGDAAILNIRIPLNK